MGVDTHGILVDIKENDLIKCLELFCSNVVSKIKKGTHVNLREGYISFNFFGEKRSLYCVLKNKKQCLKYKGETLVNSCYNDYPFLKGSIKDNYWWLSLGNNEDSLLIMGFICEELNGWIDENDCDDIDWEKKKKMSVITRKNFVRRMFS